MQLSFDLSPLSFCEKKVAERNACEIWVSMPSAEIGFLKKELGIGISRVLYKGYVNRIQQSSPRLGSIFHLSISWADIKDTALLYGNMSQSAP
jgi:hypothetical protein